MNIWKMKLLQAFSKHTSFEGNHNEDYGAYCIDGQNYSSSNLEMFCDRGYSFTEVHKVHSF